MHYASDAKKANMNRGHPINLAQQIECYFHHVFLTQNARMWLLRIKAEPTHKTLTGHSFQSALNHPRCPASTLTSRSAVHSGLFWGELCSVWELRDSDARWQQIREQNKHERHISLHGPPQCCRWKRVRTQGYDATPLFCIYTALKDNTASKMVAFPKIVTTSVNYKHLGIW